MTSESYAQAATRFHPADFQLAIRAAGSWHLRFAADGPQALGMFAQNWTLTCVCHECNQYFCRELERALGLALALGLGLALALA